MLKKNIIHQWNKWAIFNAVMTSCSIFTPSETVLIACPGMWTDIPNNHPFTHCMSRMRGNALHWTSMNHAKNTNLDHALVWMMPEDFLPKCLLSVQGSPFWPCCMPYVTLWLQFPALMFVQRIAHYCWKDDSCLDQRTLQYGKIQWQYFAPECTDQWDLKHAGNTVEVCVLMVMSEMGQQAFLLAHLKQITKARSQFLGDRQLRFLLLGHETATFGTHEPTPRNNLPSKDRKSKLLRNVGTYPPNYMALTLFGP